jgi:hypothetical protein
LFLLVLFFYFLVWYIIIQLNYFTLFVIHYIVCCMCEFSNNQVTAGKNRSLRHYRSSLSSSILLQYNLIPTCTEIYICSGSAASTTCVQRIGLLHEWIKRCTIKDNTLVTSLTSILKLYRAPRCFTSTCQ